MPKLTNLLIILFVLTACSSANSNEIADIPEASGISYCKNTDTLVVASDEGSFYELTTDGEIISEHELGDYDLEGVVCKRNKFIFAVEGGALLRVNRETLKTKLVKIKGIKNQKFKFSDKHGIEGISKRGKLYYLSIQAKKKKDAYIVVVKMKKNYAKIVRIIHHKIIDSSGLQWYHHRLYIVSDKKDKLFVYNLKQRKIMKRIKLPKFAQEGITFDDDGNAYFADDDGHVLKYGDFL